MVNNSTNINNVNKQPSLQIIEHKKNMKYAMEIQVLVWDRRMKFVIDMLHVGEFLLVHWFPPLIKLTVTILLKMALITINLTSYLNHL
jgi:hypothetical protein